MAVEIERPLDDRALIELVPCRRPFRRARTARSADVAERTALAEHLLELRAHELPRPHVLGLFLQPYDVAQRRIAVEHLAQRDDREGRELLDAADGNIGCRLATIARDEVDVDLATAEHDTFDRVCARARIAVVDHRLKAAFSQ